MGFAGVTESAPARQMLLVIPARAGSKRIPGKNIRYFAGKPMLAHAISAAQRAGVAQRVIVFTDSEEVAAVARVWGADVPFLRPAELADDHTPTGAVILHALKSLEDRGEVFDVVGCLYATAVLVNPARLAEGHAVVQSGQAISCMSVARYAFPVWRAMTVSEEGFLAPIFPEHRVSRSQDLPDALQDAGQFYWATTDAFKETGRFSGSACRPVILPVREVQDIDTEEDWEEAEFRYAWHHQAC